MGNQQGGTLVGLLFKILIFFFAAIVVMKVIPVYYQYYSILSTLKSLNTASTSSLSGDPSLDVTVLRESVSKRLEINNLNDLKPGELTITPLGTNRYKVRLKYKDVRPLVYNISLLFDFDNTIEVVAGSES